MKCGSIGRMVLNVLNLNVWRVWKWANRAIPASRLNLCNSFWIMSFQWALQSLSLRKPTWTNSCMRSAECCSPCLSDTGLNIDRKGGKDNSIKSVRQLSRVGFRLSLFIDADQLLKPHISVPHEHSNALIDLVHVSCQQLLKRPLISIIFAFNNLFSCA